MILVTGAGGLLGKKLVKVFDDDVVGVYYKSKPETSRYLSLDLSSLNIKAIEDLSPDVIIHAAALTDVDKCEKDPGLARLLNVDVTREISKVAERINAYLVYISTDYVFDGKRGNYREDDEASPINVYGLTKFEGEKEVMRFSSNYLIVRTSTPYGSNPASGKDNFALWLLRKLKNGEKVRIVSDQVTSPTLNTNFALMLKECVEKKVKGIIHLAGASPLSRYDFSVLLARTFNLDEGLISPASSSEMNWIAKRPMNSSLNVEKAMMLENKPLKIEDALKTLKKEIEENENSEII
ncbi:dTDP-4-dehydrorhamnose reductase [Acidianus manzaensis]|uniref:dTDP-4-dehydrorhamnose reductase n=1 Tax=Acidianus manzaensis TaxID=282676 RepID=A0A1W6K383_9CREN|nr:dTDP-4-dehydrorhamnose reductase [Acidianus manzaensis]ARM76957.1 dTDP-4-dehydrorhamnose reductase [Acidianus manzaensis]